MSAAGVLQDSSSVWLPPPPALPVPLPRKRERITWGKIVPQGILSRLRGRGTTQSVVEGGAASTVFPVRGAWSGPLTLVIAPEGEAARIARAIHPGFVPVHIPVRGSFVHLAPR